MQIHLSPNDGVPTYRQIVNQVKLLVASGRLAPGDELPAIRVLAEQLLINPNTVARAYRELEIAGKFDSYVRTDLDAVFLRTLRCSNCGMTTHWEPLTEPPHERMGVNANMFDPAALAGLPVVQVDGASW